VPPFVYELFFSLPLGSLNVVVANPLPPLLVGQETANACPSSNHSLFELDRLFSPFLMEEPVAVRFPPFPSLLPAPFFSFFLFFLSFSHKGLLRLNDGFSLLSFLWWVRGGIRVRSRVSLFSFLDKLFFFSPFFWGENHRTISPSFFGWLFFFPLGKGEEIMALPPPFLANSRREVAQARVPCHLRLFPPPGWAPFSER